jgi:hypothetical protein
MEIKKKIPCPLCPAGSAGLPACGFTGRPRPVILNLDCPVCAGAGAVEIETFKQRQPLMACLLDLRSHLELPLTPATINALTESFQHLSRLLENKQIPVPLETFAILGETDRRVALGAFGASILNSAIRRASEETRLRRRIILPGDR